MKNVAIIGTGRLGTRLAEQLLLDEACDNVFLWNRSKPRLRGTLRSLDIWRQILGIRAGVRKLEWSNLPQIDVVVLAIKEHYDPRHLMETEELPQWLPQDMRYIGLSRDILLVKELCNRLIQYAGTVLVVTNPVDVVSTFVQSWARCATVLGAGLSLDEARSNYFLSQMKCTAISGLRCPLGGEHGKDCIPLFSLAPPPLQIETNQTKVKESIAESSAIGYEIVKDLSYTLQDCAVVFSRDIQWILGHGGETFRSFSRWNRKACIGWPLLLKESGKLENLVVSKQELKALLTAEEHIYQIYEGASREWLTPVRLESSSVSNPS